MGLHCGARALRHLATQISGKKSGDLSKYGLGQGLGDVAILLAIFRVSARRNISLARIHCARWPTMPITTSLCCVSGNFLSIGARMCAIAFVVVWGLGGKPPWLGVQIFARTNKHELARVLRRNPPALVRLFLWLVYSHQKGRSNTSDHISCPEKSGTCIK